MAFTSITVTHTFDDAGTTAVGSVTFQLTTTMHNGTQSHQAGETIEASLTAGALSQALPATDDAGTTSLGAPLWAVTLRFTGEQARNETYFINVPSAAPGGTVDLGTLLPTVVQVS